MRVAIVVQRYGNDVPGGAELHARYVAECLAASHEVTVLTTTARDYLRWTPHFPAGRERVNGIDVERFQIERERDLLVFAEAERQAFDPDHNESDEHRYFDEQGPHAPGLWQHLEANPAQYDAVVAFSYRYATTRRAALALPRRTLLVPTAERDAVIDFALTRKLFASVAAIAFNTPEERAMIFDRVDLADTPSDVVGIGSTIPDDPQPGRFRQRYGVVGPYVLYIGRIDRNKGCDVLFDHFRAFVAETASRHTLLLIGEPVLDVPPDERLRHLGFLSDEEKFDALAGADVLIVPSPYESLSMVTLEAMALGVPALVNGCCDVLRGQVRRSNAGLYYSSYDEFFEGLALLLATPRLRELLGRNGRRFYGEHYSTDVIAAKLERLLARTFDESSPPSFLASRTT